MSKLFRWVIFKFVIFEFVNKTVNKSVNEYFARFEGDECGSVLFDNVSESNGVDGPARMRSIVKRWRSGSNSFNSSNFFACFSANKNSNGFRFFFFLMYKMY